jgi:hypothetical protein
VGSGKNCNIISKSLAILSDRARVLHACARWGVSMLAYRKPAKKGLNVEEKDEGRESVSLDRASADVDGISDAASGRVDDDSGGDPRVDAFDDGDGIWWEAKV